MLTYFDAIWKCRHFWFSLVKLDLRTRYRRSFLGIGWSLLHPICMTAILCLVFHRLFNQSIADYAPHVLAGLAVWHYVVNCTLHGCQSFFMGEQYIRQTPMPLAIFPLRTVLSATFHFAVAIGLVVLIVIGLDIAGLRAVNYATVPLVVPALAMLFLFCWSVAILAGLMTVYFRDTQHLCEVGFQICFYATPIIFKARLLEEHGLGWLVRFNPLVVFLRLIREPLLEGTAPSAFTYLEGLGIIAAAAGLASLLMARLQKRLIFHL